jgi:DNA-binding LacI/PurR family transcriptional regulator
MGLGTPRLAVANPGFLPYVCAMGTPPEALLQADYVTYNNRMIGVVAAQYMLSRGHHRCGVLSGVQGGFWDIRTDGFRRTLEAAGGRVTVFCIAQSGPSWQIPTADIVAAGADMQGMFCQADELTVALYPELFRHGIHPGRDLDIVSCNNERSLIQALNPVPAEVDIHAELVGRRAVEQLLWRLENLTAAYVRTELDPELVTVSPGKPVRQSNFAEG